jgi:putative ABC transport system ATP-binding protein
VIQLFDVSKRYGAAPPCAALDGVHLAIAAGEFVALHGPRGCGKTTLLNIVGLLERPSSGTYLFAGLDVSRQSEHALAALRQRGVAFVFRQAFLADELDVYHNVELTLRHQNVARSRRKQMVREVLELLDLDGRAEDYPDALSPCEQRRVAIARALVNDPRLIVADEPTAGLDAASRAAVIDMIATLHRAGATVLAATDSPECAARADRTVRLNEGRISAAEPLRI